MPSRMTKAQIVSTALKLVGTAATDLQIEGELWLDLLLAQAAQTYRFPELEKTHTATVASGAATVATPTDYGSLVRDGNLRGAVGYILDAGAVKTPVYLRMLAEILQQTALGIADDLSASQWQTYLDSAGTLTLQYQANPVAVASTAVVWYPNDLELVQQIKVLAERYMRGKLLAVDAQIAAAAEVLGRRSLSRMRLFTQGGPGADLDSRWFV